ncbi:hypothetical protein LCGC14_1891630 [marine sediment metagenome]|uniref:Uncharacterized protein n=1 Tax=marine sediment metagenome TaxID=412755 RepID=A0A0F9IXI5_9ZZZZ
MAQIISVENVSAKEEKATMYGVMFDKRYNLWMLYNLNICECGTHICKNIIAGNKDKEDILKLIR